jgi:hypothetical protein
LIFSRVWCILCRSRCKVPVTCWPHTGENSLLCSKCRMEKDPSEFSVKSSKTKKRSTICRVCRNEYARNVWYPANREKQIEASCKWKINNRSRALSKQYGIPSEDIDIAMKRADGKCDVCGKESTLVFEHEHTGCIVRGFVCKRCNLILGLLGDKKEEIESSMALISKYIDNAYKAGK